MLLRVLASGSVRSQNQLHRAMEISPECTPLFAKSPMGHITLSHPLFGTIKVEQREVT
jgi:hypothetical protein